MFANLEIISVEFLLLIQQFISYRDHPQTAQKQFVSINITLTGTELSERMRALLAYMWLPKLCSATLDEVSVQYAK